MVVLHLHDTVARFCARMKLSLRCRNPGEPALAWHMHKRHKNKTEMNSLRHESGLGILNALSEFRPEVISTLTWRKDGVFACDLIRETD